MSEIKEYGDFTFVKMDRVLPPIGEWMIKRLVDEKGKYAFFFGYYYLDLTEEKTYNTRFMSSQYGFLWPQEPIKDEYGWALLKIEKKQSNLKFENGKEYIIIYQNKFGKLDFSNEIYMDHFNLEDDEELIAVINYKDLLVDTV